MSSTLSEKFPKKILPLLLIGLGAFLRFLYLGRIPDGLHQDEAFVALNAFGMYHELRDSAGLFMPVYMSSWGDGQSALYTWMLTPLLACNGGHVNYLLCRLPQAVVATATLAAVYGLMRRMFGEIMGLLSLFLLAVCPWHIMMSRWALDANLLPGFLIFGLYFFIRSLENEKFLPLSAFFYGLSLYCYAVGWPVLPVVLLLQISYSFFHKKLRINKWSLLSALILFLMALPLMLFVLINADFLPQITLPFMTIPKTSGYRGGELAKNIPDLIEHFRTALRLLVKQDTGSPYDILRPWGLFYDIGRIFIAIGVPAIVVKVGISFLKKNFCYEYFLFCSLVGGGITCLLVRANMHQVNSLFIPLVLGEAYGLYLVLHWIFQKKPKLSYLLSGVVIAVYFICLAGFQKDYYTGYKKIANAYFGQGIQECVEYAVAQCAETGLHTITAEKGAQWPRLLLFTETLPSEYLSAVTYDIAPAPASFEAHGLHINTRIHYDSLRQDSFYIIYYTDKETFEKDFELTQFYDWYVASPKNPAP